MNRRQVIVAGSLAAVSAMAFGKDIVAKSPRIPPAGTRPSDPPMVAPASAGALLPIEFFQRGPSNVVCELQIGTFWPAQIASGISHWDFDLQVYDDFTVPQWVYAWQLRRSPSGMVQAGQGLRMGFTDGARLDLTATVRTAAGRNAVFSASIPSGALMVLTTARSSTGLAPLLTDLRYDPDKRSLNMADGSPRDFDALLLRTT